MLKSILLTTTLLASAFAQSGTSVVTSSATAVTSTATQEMPVQATAGFNSGLVNRTQTLQWCQAQRNTCPDICGGRVSSNNCNENTLTYSCICSNGTVPDCTAFEQTLPYFICQQTYIQCLQQHPSTDPDGQQQCIANQECGTRNATAERAAVATSSSSASGSATGSASGTAASSTSSQAGATSVTSVSTGAFVALLFAACKLLL